MNLIRALQGSKTHMLVIAAAVLNTIAADTSTTPELLETLRNDMLILSVSTFKAGVERGLVRLFGGQS